MAEKTVAGYTTTKIPDLAATYANQKSLVVNGTHDSVVNTIVTSATISGITAPLYLINNRTGEIIYAEGTSGANFTTCIRGADNTTAAAMQTGDILRFAPVANDINQIIREIIAIALDAKEAANAERIALQSHIHDEIMRYIPPKIQFDNDITHFLRGDNTFTTIPTSTILQSEFDIVLYCRVFE